MDSRPQEKRHRAKSDEAERFARDRRTMFSACAPAQNAVGHCARCGGDWRGRCEGGGLLFDGAPVCPDCAPALWDQVRDAGVEYLVEDFPRRGEDFATACARWASRSRQIATRRRGPALTMIKS